MFTVPCAQDAAAPKPSISHDTSTIPNVDGGFTHIKYDPVNFKEVYLDEYTREPLPTDLVREAIEEELK